MTRPPVEDEPRPGPRRGRRITAWKRAADESTPGSELACPHGRLGADQAVTGSWVVGDAAAGIGIRADASPITRNTSRFVPHYYT